MKQIKDLPRYLGVLLLHLALAILTGALLLSAIRLLPAAPMEQHLTESAPVFAEEGIYPSLFPWCTSQLDSTTDALILLISACDTGETPLVQAMTATRNQVSSQEASSDQLAAHYGSGVPFDGSEPYYQYWHGYQLFIRPLLSIMSYSGIRILNGSLQTGLLLLLCLMLYKKGAKQYILPYLAAVAMLMPLALAKSLQFSSCYYVLTISSILLLWKQKALDQADGLLFLYTGIATAYFDFLTYPAATLAIPAVFYFCIRRTASIRDTFCRGVKICFSWALGYGGMWAGKWLLGSLVLKQNLFILALDKLTARSLANAEDHGLIYNIRAVLSANIRSFLHTPATLAAVLLAGVLLVLVLRNLLSQKTAPGELGRILFPFAVLALVPPVWYVVTANHALIHYWFTNKALAASVFAALAGLAKASRTSQ